MDAGVETESDKQFSLPVFRRRSGIVFCFLAVWAVFAAAHVFYYAYVSRKQLLDDSFQLAWRDGILPAVRGRILSRDGRELAWTEIRYDLRIESIPGNSARCEKLMSGVRAFFPPESVPDPDSGTVLLKESIPPETILKMEKLLRNFPELRVVPRFIRRCAIYDSVRRVIGEVSRDSEGILHGASGLEAAHDRVLSGCPGRFRVMLDRRYDWVGGTVRILKDPVHGQDVVLPQSLSAILESGAEKEVPHGGVNE